MFALRSSVMVMADMPMSHWPAFSTVPDCSASKATSWMVSSRPSSSAIAWVMSTSKPE